MLSLALDVAFTLLAAAMLLNLYRLLKGPDLVDRALALDTLQVNAAAALVLHGVRLGSTDYYEVALLIALFGFVGSVALGRYLARGRVVE